MCSNGNGVSSSTDSDQLQFTRNLFWEVYLGNLYELQKKLKSILDGTDKHEGLYIEEILGADMQFVFDPRTKCVDWHIFLGLSSNCYLSMQLETKQLESLLIYLQVATLYCLDEPENSLSAKMQIQLSSMIEDMTRGCGCQFIIATHSPFLLAMRGACVFDLDTIPVKERNWWELENIRVFYDFFHRNANLFEQ